MSEPVAPDGRGGVRAGWWVAVGSLVVVLVAVAVVLLGRGDGAPAGSSPTESGAPGTPTVAGAQAVKPPEGEQGAGTDDDDAADGAAEDAAAGSADDAAPTTVGIDAVAQLADSVTARVSSWEAVDGEAVQPGEKAGPALRVTVEVANGTAAPLDLRAAVVNLSYGPERTPATALSQPGGSPLPHAVEPGATADGAFVFAVPADARGDVHLELDVRAVGPVVVFAGSAQP